MDWFEFQLLYVSPAHLLVWPLMSSKLANREEEKEQQWAARRLQTACSGPEEELLSTSRTLGFRWWDWCPVLGSYSRSWGPEDCWFGDQALAKSHPGPCVVFWEGFSSRFLVSQWETPARMAGYSPDSVPHKQTNKQTHCP